MKAGALGDIFADFRNLSLRRCLRHESEIGYIPSTTSAPSECSLRSRIEGVSFKRGEDIEWVDAIFPILLAAEPGDRPERKPAGAMEYTFSKFKSRCIYGAGFGPQQYPPPVALENPLTFITLFSHDEWRQIGRMINRLNTLGTLRLAALYGLRKMMMADDSALFDLDRELNEVHDSISALAEKKDPGEGRFHQPARGELASIGNKLCEIHYKLAKLESPIKGGISHRAMRSLYYRKRFSTLLEALHIRNIDGYQPYHHFVLHRLDRAYAMMEAIGTRYRQLVAKEVDLRRQWFDIKSEQHQDEIKRMQRLAEAVLFVALVPYYLSHFAEMYLKNPEALMYSRQEIASIAFFGSIAYWIAARKHLVSRMRILILQYLGRMPFARKVNPATSSPARPSGQAPPLLTGFDIGPGFAEPPVKSFRRGNSKNDHQHKR